MFAFAGQPAARFFQGQYLFVFGFAYIPWIIITCCRWQEPPGAGEILLFKESRTWHAAVSLALLYFSGNAYYPFYMLLGRWSCW